MMNFTKEQGAEIIVFAFLKKETRKYKSYQSCNANPNNIIEMNLTQFFKILVKKKNLSL